MSEDKFIKVDTMAPYMQQLIDQMLTITAKIFHESQKENVSGKEFIITCPVRKVTVVARSGDLEKDLKQLNEDKNNYIRRN